MLASSVLDDIQRYLNVEVRARFASNSVPPCGPSSWAMLPPHEYMSCFGFFAAARLRCWMRNGCTSHSLLASQQHRSVVGG